MKTTRSVLNDRLNQVNKLGFNLKITYQNGGILLREGETMNYLTPCNNKEVYNYLEGILTAVDRIKKLEININ